jgi:uncharacterized LabA/DUF88 family protein
MLKHEVCQTRLRTSIFIDYRNIHYYLIRYKWEIDWEKFKTYFGKKYDLQEIYFYEGLITKTAFFDTHKNRNLNDFNNQKKGKETFFKFLKDNGYIVRTKPVQRLYDDRTKSFKHKCNFDVELTIDAINTIDKYDQCILGSGDGDFIKLVKYLKGKHKIVLIMAGKDRLSNELLKTAHQLIYLKDIKRKIAR